MRISKLIKKPIGRSKVEFYVTIDGEDLDEVIDYCIAIIARSSYIFIPEEDDAETILRETLGDRQFNYLLKNHVMGRVMPFIIKDEADLDMAFDPTCTSNEVPRKGGSFTFTIKVILRPKYTISSYDPVEVTVPRYKVAEEAIDEQIEQIAQMNTNYKKIPDKGEPIQMGQLIQLDMHCEQHGEELPGLCGEGRLFEVVYGYMPEQFVDNIVGMKVGETKEFEFEAVKDDAKDMNDTDMYQCKVTVTSLMKKMVPKISNAWVEVNMPDAGNLEGLRAQIREQLESQNEEQVQQSISEAVDFAFAERFQGTISDDLYETAASSMIDNMERNLQQQGKTLEGFMEEQGINRQQLNMEVMIQARNVIRQGLSLDKLWEDKFGVITDEDIEYAYSTIAPGHEEDAKQQFKESGREYAIEQVAKRLVAHKWLLETATVHYRDVDPSELEGQDGPTVVQA